VEAIDVFLAIVELTFSAGEGHLGHPVQHPFDIRHPAFAMS
jgi:hypothetical protein